MKLLGLLSAMATFVVASTVSATRSIAEETKTIAELHAAAVKEGGGLVVYHGGDQSLQQDALRAAWKAAFPDVNLTVVVDYSKFHDVRADNQLARGDLEVDIVALQTLQNFPRWAKNGDLLQYKPAGFSKIYDKFKDPQGFWMSHRHSTFGFTYDEAQLGGLTPPTSPADLVDPKWAGKIASAYPNDGDATLFVYTQYAKKYGWEWVEKMAKQQIEFGRGTNTPGDAQAAKRKAIGVGAGISLAPSTSTIKPVYGNGVPFLLWGQRIAIFKKAKHPAAAKLFMNWILTKEVQTTTLAGRSIRTDVTPPLGGTNFSWNIPEANVDAFDKFMADRAEVERLRFTFSLNFGEVEGKPSPGWFGIYPSEQ